MAHDRDEICRCRRSQEEIDDIASRVNFFLFHCFFFTPTHLYFTNITEYSSPFMKIAPALLLISMPLGLITAVLSAFCPFSIHRRLITLLFIAGVLLWLQGNILVWDYGPLDGSEIDWNVKVTNGLIDSMVWTALVVVSVLFPTQIYRIVARTSYAFILIQLVSIGLDVVRAPDASRLHEELKISEESIYEFSPERNVIILVLDSFQGNIFNDIISEEPRYAENLRGFTYFRNSLGGFPFTPASVPLILTGRYYENSIPLKQFTREAFLGNSIPRVLKRNDYQVDLLGFPNIFYTDETVASNGVAIEHLIDQHVELREAAFMLDISVFRCVPHFLKKFLYENRGWFFSRFCENVAFGGFPTSKHLDCIEFVKEMTTRARVKKEGNTFKFMHLYLPHPPGIINEQLEYEGKIPGRDNYKKQAMAALNLTDMLFRKLEELGIYDNSMIFVLADHGLGRPIEIEEYRDPKGIRRRFPDIDKAKAAALPLFLVKPFMSRGEMKISDAPVSLADVGKTIFSELGMNVDIPGASVFGIKSSDTRKRRFLYYARGDRRLPGGHLDPMREFIVTGFSWRDESWQMTDRVYTSAGLTHVPMRTYP